MVTRRRTRRRSRKRDRQVSVHLSDRFTLVLQRVILGTGTIGVIYGQAELLGEPWRHILTVACAVALVAVAIWMKKT